VEAADDKNGEGRALVLAQGENRIRVELASVRGLVAALADGAADLPPLPGPTSDLMQQRPASLSALF
jgi:hypothetical protein